MSISNSIKALLAKHRRHLRKPHIVIGAGSLGVALLVLSVILISGKSRRAQASDRSIIDIALPNPSEMAYAARLRSEADLRWNLGDMPAGSSAIHEKVPEPLEPVVSIGSGSLTARPGVILTKDLANFANGLSSFCSQHHLSVMITSGVRSGEGQLEIIKQKIAGAGMMHAFPGLMDATVQNRASWEPAWQWLKRQRFPVNPPADCVKQDGTEAGASLHVKGLALDVIGGNLDALTRALVRFASTPEAYGPLRMTSLTRERDCVHIALAR